MPSLGSGDATAVASTTDSPWVTRAAPEACLAMRPVSKCSCLPPASSTVTSCFMESSFSEWKGRLRLALLHRARKNQQRLAGSRMEWPHRSGTGTREIGRAHGLNSSHPSTSYAVFCLTIHSLDLHPSPTRRSSDLPFQSAVACLQQAQL